jgi:hypothetical protein
MIHGGIEGFDGSVNGRLDADENSDSQGDPYHRKKGSPFMVAKVAERDVLEKMKEEHGKIQMSKCKCQMNTK